MYKMRKPIELKSAIDNLFCCVELLPFVEEILEEHLDYDDLAQAIQHFAEPVYAFATWSAESSSCEYRGEPLFPFHATLIYTVPCMSSALDSGVITERHLEIWLTDDMKFAVVSNFRTEFCDGEFVSAYRVIKTTDPDEFAQVIDLDYNELALMLVALSKLYNNSDMPTYEL